MDSWRVEISDVLERLVDSAVTAGARQAEVFAELKKAIEQFEAANDRDPDPADAPTEMIDEPANEWPGADR
jgi:hypothetical protein